MIFKRAFKLDRRRLKRQLLNTSVHVLTEAGQLDALGINLSDVGMCLASTHGVKGKDITSADEPVR